MLCGVYGHGTQKGEESKEGDLTTFRDFLGRNFILAALSDGAAIFCRTLPKHQVHRGYTNKDGLPPGNIEKIVCDNLHSVLKIMAG